MSFEGLQERLTALQETTSQLRQLIDNLANTTFEPGSVPQGSSEEGTLSSDSSLEINHILKEEDDELELLQEEIEYLPSGRAGSEADHQRARLKDSVQRLGQELSRYGISYESAHERALDGSNSNEYFL
jgi:protein transport protein SEC20